MIKNYLKVTRNAMGLIILSCIIGFVLLLGVYALPTGKMVDHVIESKPIYQYEGEYPNIIKTNDATKLDNFTDTLMLSTAITGKGNIIERAVLTKNSSLENEGRFAYISKLNKNKIYKGSKVIINEYSRYWHGYLLYLKPLLLLFNIGQIRIMSMCLNLILIVYLVILLHNKLNMFKTSAIVAPLLVLNPVTTSLSLQFSNCYYLTLFGLIFLLKFYKLLSKKKSFAYYFGLMGILTAYFDLLTFPIVTLGIPLITYIMLQNEKEFDNTSVFNTLFYSFIWTISYAGMWVSKWLLGSLLLKRNLVKNAIEALLFRTSDTTAIPGTNSGTIFTVKDVFIKNYMYIKDYSIILIGFLFIGLIILILCNKYRISNFNYRVLLTLVLVGIYPLIWFTVLKNHSYIHSFFTHKDLSITVYALVCIIATCFEKNESNGN